MSNDTFDAAPAVRGLVKDLYDIYLQGRDPADHDAELLRLIFRGSADESIGGSVDAATYYFDALRKYGPRRVCQYQFKKNDIVWICKDCQKDETCVLCNECFHGSKHEGHDVYFYHSSSGGCCDCGDYDAWEPAGFCTKHGCICGDPLQYMPTPVTSHAREVVEEIISQLHDFFVDYADIYTRIDTEEGSSCEEATIVVLADDFHKNHEAAQVFGSLPGVSDMQADAHSRALQVDGYVHYRYRRSDSNEEERSDSWSVDDAVEAFRSAGITAGVASKRLLLREAVVLKHIAWLYTLAQTNDGMCSIICKAFSIPILTEICMRDHFLKKSTVVALHTMFLTVMADQSFKQSVAVAYAKSYPEFSKQYTKGIGVSEYSIFGISVQFLNRLTFVSQITFQHDFMGRVTDAVEAMLLEAQNGPSLALSSPILTYRRYYPLLSDLKVAFSIPGMSRVYLSQVLLQLLKILSFSQRMHPQVMQTVNHVEYEGNEWVSAFNLYISLASTFDYLTNWLESVSDDADQHLLIESGDVSLAFSYEVYKPTRGLSWGSAEEFAMKATDGVVGGGAIGESAVDAIPSSYPLIHLNSTIATLFREVIRWHLKLLDSCDHGSLEALVVYSWRSDDSIIADGYRATILAKPKEYSFHPVLHRLLAAFLTECFKFPGLSKTLWSLQMSVRATLPRDRLLYSLVDVPLTTLLFAAQIRLGLWRRNGAIMSDQLLNYADPPFCRMARDLDLTLLQYLGSICGADELVSMVFNRFNVHSFVSPSAVFMPSAQLQLESVMLEEALVLFIHIVTELPAPANTDLTQRCLPMVRREFIHKLASGPCTFSKLQECLPHSPEVGKINPEQIAAIVRSVSDYRDSVNLEPPKRVLKAELWREYDPAYMRLTVSAHQLALESMPKITEPQPIVVPPPAAHDTLRALRTEVLFSSHLLFAMRSLVLAATTKRVGRNASAAAGSKDGKKYAILIGRGIECGDSALQRIIHIITLAVHECRLVRSGSAEGEGAIGEKAKVLARRFVKFLVEEVEVQHSKPVSDEVGAEETTTVIMLPSLLNALYDLMESHASTSADGNMYQWLKWIVTAAADLDADCCAMIDTLVREKKSASKAKELEAKKKRARERAMKAMQASAKSFAAHIDDQQEERQEDGRAAGEAGGGALRKAGKARGMSSDADASMDESDLIEDESLSLDMDMDDAVPDCIICQNRCLPEQDGNASLGYICFSHSSTCLGSLRPSLHSEQQGSIKSGAPRIHMRFCGHAVHYSCFDVYFASENSKREIQGGLFLNVDRGQFYCPLCKSVSNMLVPHVDDNVNNLCFASAPWEDAAAVSSGQADDSNRNEVSKVPQEGQQGAAERRGENQCIQADLMRLHDIRLGGEVQRAHADVVMDSDFDAADIEAGMEATTGSVATSSVLEVGAFWQRFVKTLCEPMRGLMSSNQLRAHNDFISTIGFSSAKEFLQCVDVASSALVTTAFIRMLSNDRENLYKYRLQPPHWVEELQETSAVKSANRSIWGYIQKGILALGVAVERCGLLEQLLCEFNELLKGSYTRGPFCEGDDEPLGEAASFDGESVAFLFQANASADATPLLARPLHESLSLFVGLHRARKSSAAAAPGLSLESSVQCLCLASLVQLIVSEVQKAVRTYRGELLLDFPEDSYLGQTDAKMGFTAFTQTALRTLRAQRPLQQESASVLGEMYGFVRKVACMAISRATAATEGSARERLAGLVVGNQESMTRLLWRWLSYLTYAHNILFGEAGEEASVKMDVEGDAAGDTALLAHLHKFTDIFRLNVVFRQAESAEDMACHKLVDKWVTALAVWVSASRSHDVVYSKEAFICELPNAAHMPTPTARPRLLQIPTSYTQFHSQVLAHSQVTADREVGAAAGVVPAQIELPGVCLQCGAVMDAGGKGKCSEHVLACGADCGVVFLLQDHRILLLHGLHSAYYPAPFVDEYGETHRNYRGKPLHLDKQRYAALEKMWLSHNVPSEVVQKRTSSGRVIINNYY